MSITVTGRLFLHRENNINETLSYMKKICITCDDLNEHGYNFSKEYIYEIEIEEKPSIIETLKMCGYFKKEKILNISKICELGITFYLVEQYMVDGFLFIPMSNVVAIHTINKNNLKNLINQEESF